MHRENEKHTGKRGKHALSHAKPVGESDAEPGIGDREKRGEQFEEKTGGIEFNHTGWRNWPTQSPLCSRDDGLPVQLDGVAFQKWREQSVKMYGNAVVPELVMQIFNLIVNTRKHTIKYDFNAKVECANYK